MTDRPPDAIELARRALSRTPAGFLTDLDGTIAPIVADPAAARLADRGPAALRALAGRLAVTGIVTGRAARDAHRIAGVDELLVVGNHGLEWLEPGASQPAPAPGLAWISDELDRVMGMARDALGDPGVTLDHKGLSGTIHYRMAADPAAARARLLDALDALPHPGIEVREGRMSIELRPTGVGDKGTAVRQIVERHGLRGLVVMGDDVTDLDMFRAAAELRRAGTIEAAILAVGGDGEVPPAIIAESDAVLSEPAAVVALLEALVSS
ncbi:MAG TPA: trehalose-phosphatase [Candidatus Limnocylindria bacterium]|nr:trehalose-phosphatase [Candidatus Limnocylindria bacterium]